MTSRERFEAWASRRPMKMYFDCLTGTDGVTCYADTATQSAWEAWQAAEAATAKECAELAFDTYRQYRPKEDEFGEGKSEGAKEVAYIIAREFPEAFK